MRLFIEIVGIVVSMWRRRNISRIPVVLLGLDINGLTVCRALGKEKIPIIGVSRSPDSLGCHSKYLKALYVIDFSDDAIVDLLMSDEISFVDKPLLFPTTDQTVEVVSKYANIFSKKYTLPFSSPSLVLDLLNKNKFKAISEKIMLKVALGTSFRQGGAINLSRIPSYPVIIKTCKKLYNKPIDTVLPKAVIANNEDEAGKWITRYLEYAEECLVEEYIAGSDKNVFFVFVYCNSKNKVIIDYCGRKMRQWPILTGGTASARPWNEDSLVFITRSFFDNINYSGLASMEFKYDINRREYYAIEPTVGRIDFQEGLAIRNGYNFPLALYSDLNGFKYNFPQNRVSRKEWVSFDADYNAASALAGGSKLKIIFWFLWLLKPKIYSVFSLTDVMPFIHWVKKRFLNVQ